MDTNQQNPAFQVPRRSDLAVNDAPWIKNFLMHAPYGVIAFIQDNQPYLHTNLFVYEMPGQKIYMHSGRKGRMPAAVSGGVHACFTVAEMGRILPAREAMSFDVEYASVVAFGQLINIEDREECQHGLQLLLDKYAKHLKPGINYRGIQPKELEKTAVYRFKIESWSGKMNLAPSDFPGAFYYPAWSVLQTTR
jgi:uncharacterized protein